MQPDLLERYSRLDSPVHRLPTAVKFAGAGALLLTVVLTPLPPYWAPLALALLLAGLVAASRIPPRFLLRRLLWLEPFVLGVALLSLWQPHGPAIFLKLVTRGSLALATVLLYAHTTPFAATLALLRRLRLPGLLTTTLALLYRYLFVLVEETERMTRARASRTFRPAVGGPWRRWPLLAGVAGQLFVRASERAERIYAAMCARGWTT